MHFMIIIFIFVLGAVIWGFFHSNPAGVARGPLLFCNVVVLVLAAVTAAVVGEAMYADAVVVKAGEKGLAAYLAIMAGGTSSLIVVAVGGLLRNLVFFPRSRRKLPDPSAGA